MYSVQIAPVIHGLAGELSPVVHGDRLRCAAECNHLVECGRDLVSAERRVGMERQTLAGVLIDHCRHPDPAAVGEPLCDEIHAPSMVDRAGLA